MKKLPVNFYLCRQKARNMFRKNERSFLENSNRWLKDLYNKTDSKRQKLNQKEITFQEDSSESLSKDRKKE